MPIFRIHRMKENARLQFRWAPHSGGVTMLKPRDFEPAGEIDAPHCYGAWTQLRGAEDALQVGDVLESERGELHICKYVGFEEARWVQPETRLAQEQLPVQQSSAQPAA